MPRSFQMFSTVVSVLVFTALRLTSVECEDWCSLIKPNGTYEGLGMYRHFGVKDKGFGSYVMYNRAGTQWMFGIRNTTDRHEIDLEMIDNSTKQWNHMNVVHRFGFYIDHFSTTTGGSVTDTVFVDCTVKTVVTLFQIQFQIILSIDW